MNDTKEMAAKGAGAGHRYRHARAALTADCVVLERGERDGVGVGPRVLLVQRDRAPFAGCWALPGGFVDPGEPLEAAARRELAEETGLVVGPLLQVGSFGRVDRDPRGRVVSVAYCTVLERSEQPPRAGDDARAAAFFALAELPALAFDHAEIIGAALRCLRRRDAAPPPEQRRDAAPRPEGSMTCAP